MYRVEESFFNDTNPNFPSKEIVVRCLKYGYTLND